MKRSKGLSAGSTVHGKALPGNGEKETHAAVSFVDVTRLSILILIGLYVLYRIFTLDLMSDEWGGLKNIYIKSIADLISFKYVDAQSHFLQSLLSISCWRGFPEAYEGITIRLPSLIGLCAFLYAAFRITALGESGFLKTLGLLALCTNAFLLDYFGLARGYCGSPRFLDR